MKREAKPLRVISNVEGGKYLKANPKLEVRQIVKGNLRSEGRQIL